MPRVRREPPVVAEMTPNTRALTVIDRDGEVVDIDLSPVSLETAGARLPQIDRAIQILREHKTFLEGVITSSFVPGQVEKRIANQLYEYKPETAWEVTDPEVLYGLLVEAEARQEITDEELAAAGERKTVFSFHNGRLNVLVKRIPAIDQFRTQRIGVAKLRIKK